MYLARMLSYTTIWDNYVTLSVTAVVWLCILPSLLVQSCIILRIDCEYGKCMYFCLIV